MGLGPRGDESMKRRADPAHFGHRPTGHPRTLAPSLPAQEGQYRRKCNAMIIVDVHARDIVDRFVRDSVIDHRPGPGPLGGGRARGSTRIRNSVGDACISTEKILDYPAMFLLAKVQ